MFVRTAVKNTFKILLVDDSDFDREKIIRALKWNEGKVYEFQELECSEHVEKLSLEWNPDLVIIDHSLPKVSGIEFLSHVFKKHGRLPFAVVMVTGSGDEAVAVDAMKLGVLDYLVKERLTTERIREVVDQALEKSLLQKRLQEQDLLLKEEKQRLQKALEELKEEQILREHFVAGLTHDLRNPLTVLKSSIQLIVKYKNRPELLEELYSGMINNVDRADRMIRNLLDAHRLTAQENLDMHFSECDLVALSKNILSELNQVYGDRLVLVIIDKFTELKGFWSEDDLRRIIENFIDNAVKYGDPIKKITLTLSLSLASEASFKIHNWGGGLDATELNKLFGAYYRSPGVINNKIRGWGLGLSLIKQKVAAHNGRIHVESSPEQGTTFEVNLPLIKK